MRRRILRNLIAVGILAALAAAAFACGGGDDETSPATASPEAKQSPEGGGSAAAIGSYFDELDAIHDAYIERGDALELRHPNAFLEPDATRDYYEELLPQLKDYLSEFSDMDSPDEVEDAHRELLDALSDLVETLEDFVDLLGDAGSESELETVLNALSDDPEFTAAADRFQNACVTLQSIADENDIAIDLECAETEETIVLSLEEYFQEIDTIFEESDQAVEDVTADFDAAMDAATTVEEQVAALKSFLDETNRVLFLSILQLGGLEPPPEVAASHNDFLDQVEAVAQISEDFLARLPDVQTNADLEALISELDFDLSVATATADDACLEMQGVADDNGIIVDLNCLD